MNAELDDWYEASVEPLSEVWKSTIPSDAETDRAVRRFWRQRAVRRKPRPFFFVMAAQGFFLGLVTIALGTWVRTGELPWSKPASNAHTSPSNPTESRHRTATQAAAPTPTGSVPIQAFDGVTARSREPLAPPDRAPSSKSRRAEPKPRAPEVSKEPEPGSAMMAASPIAASEERGAWVRVARALAAHDLEGADAALGELCKASDPGVQDAAELARAELWSGSGRAIQYRPTIERLAVSGRTPFIRKRAAAILAGIK
jgi:hypothetical protein